LCEDMRLLLEHDNPLIKFTQQFPSDAEQYCFWERTGATYLMLYNLVKNACEAVTDRFKGEVGGIVELKAVVINNQVLISIKDNGGGMSQEQMVAVLVSVHAVCSGLEANG
jgi:nitrogen fixation/metabolism regulation signal transduction histidine kinase